MYSIIEKKMCWKKETCSFEYKWN